MTRRWIIVLTAEDGGTSAYGPWEDGETAAALADKLREHSSRYGGDGPEMDVSVEWVERWPGMAVVLAEMGVG